MVVAINTYNRILCCSARFRYKSKCGDVHDYILAEAKNSCGLLVKSPEKCICKAMRRGNTVKLPSALAEDSFLKISRLSRLPRGIDGDDLRFAFSGPG